MNCENCKYWQPLPTLPSYNDEDEDDKFWRIESNALTLASLESFKAKSNRGQCTRIPSLSSSSLIDTITDDSFSVAEYNAELESEGGKKAELPIKAYMSVFYFDPYELNYCFVTSWDFGCVMFEERHD